jgi:hypothetical protein
MDGTVYTHAMLRWNRRAAAISCLVVGGSCHAVSTSGPAALAPLDAVDEFERAELGANWSVVSGSAAGIVAGRDFGALFLGPVSVDWATDLGANQFSEVIIAGGKDANMLVQVHVRKQASTRARYGFHWNPEHTPAQWEIKFDGVPTAQTRILASAAGDGPANGDVIRIEAYGREIRGYHNGRLVLAATDSAADAVLISGGAGITARPKTGTVTSYPAPIAARWRGGRASGQTGGAN